MPPWRHAPRLLWVALTPCPRSIHSSAGRLGAWLGGVAYPHVARHGPARLPHQQWLDYSLPKLEHADDATRESGNEAGEAM